MSLIDNSSWAVTHFLKDKDAVESDDLPLFFDLFLREVSHPVLHHALKKHFMIFHIIGVLIGAWVLDLLIEILMEIDLLFEFKPVLLCDSD